MKLENQKKVSFGATETRLFETNLPVDTTTEKTIIYTTAEARILKSDRSESRIAKEIIEDDKFNQIGEAHEDGTDGDPNAVRGELSGTAVPSLSDFGHKVEAFNLSEERDTGLLRAARNTTIIGRGEEEEHEDDQWLKDNSIIDAKVLARMKAKEHDKETQENLRRKKTDRAWLQEVIDLLVDDHETVPIGLRRLRPTKKTNSNGGGWRKRSQQQQQQQQQHQRVQQTMDWRSASPSPFASNTTNTNTNNNNNGSRNDIVNSPFAPLREAFREFDV